MFFPPDKIDGHYSVGPDHLVFAKERYVEGQKPSSVYIPKEFVMLKIMRACLKCEDENQLWFN